MYFSGTFQYNHHACALGVGVSTFVITPNFSIWSSSFQTLDFEGTGMCLVVLFQFSVLELK